MEQQTEASPRRPALYETHALAGANFAEVDGWLLPAYYSDPVAENLAVRSSAGIGDLPYRGYLKISGPDRASFLQGIITNDTSNLNPGDGLHSALLTVKGHVIADFILLAFTDHFLLETEASVLEKLRTALARYKIREKVAIEPQSEIGAVIVQGPRSPAQIAKLLGNQLPEIDPYHHLTIETDGTPFTVRRQTLTGEAGYILTMPSTSLAVIWRRLTETASEDSVLPIGYQAMESLRVEAGIPRFGRDLTEENIPLEILGEDMVNFTKGCYVGQETVARLKFLGQANKHLRGLLFNGTNPPSQGARIMNGEKDAGSVTSSAYSPTLKRAIAMGYIRREASAPNTQVSVSADPATVTELPFIKR